MGGEGEEWQNTKSVLTHFGGSQKEKIGRYRKFIQDGWKMGRRTDLTGGGLRRSAGGWAGVAGLKREGAGWRGDERVLGEGSFVSEMLKSSEEKMVNRENLKRAGWTLERLAHKVCDHYSLPFEKLQKKGRENSVSKAKGLIVYLGRTKIGLSGKTLADFLSISGSAVSQMIGRGESESRTIGINLLN